MFHNGKLIEAHSAKRQCDVDVTERGNTEPTWMRAIEGYGSFRAIAQLSCLNAVEMANFISKHLETLGEFIDADIAKVVIGAFRDVAVHAANAMLTAADSLRAIEDRL